MVVYQSTISVACAADGTFPVTPVNYAPGVEQYRRWVDNKSFSCTDMGSYIAVSLNNQDVEFLNLPPDAEYTLNYIDNGVNTPSGPYTVEQTSGTHAYGSFQESLPGYPLTFEFRIDTLIGGVVVYQSSLYVACSADDEGSLTPINVIPTSSSGGVSLPTNCTYVLPDTAIQGRLLQSTTAYFGPQLEDSTNIVMDAGGAWWIMDARNGFYKLWISCAATPIWVPATTMGPNYDAVWGGAPLPDAGS